MMLKQLFSRHWWKTTLFVLAAVAVMVRLGIWQLDRLEQRRAFNTRVEAQISAAPLELSAGNIDTDLYEMEYRSVNIAGEYDYTNQVVLRNQDWQGLLGVHILTPLRIEGSESLVLVDRGWVPYEDYTAGNLDQYDVPGEVEVEGIIRRSQSKPAIGGKADQLPGPGDSPLDAWYWINIPDISKQLPYELLPVYVAAQPAAGGQQLPYRAETELDLSEGSHQGYALQWFTFAAILGIGYPFYIRRESNRQASEAAENGEVSPAANSQSKPNPEYQG